MINFTVPVLVAALTSLGLYYVAPDEYGGFDAFGAISFPTSLDSFTNPTATDKTKSPSHATQHSNANDAIEALEAKVGIDGSAVTSSHDYKLSGVTGSDKAASLAGSETLLNKTLISSILNSPSATNTTATTSTLYGTTTIDANGENIVLNLGSDAAGDIYYRNSSGYLTRLGIGSAGQQLQVSGGLPSWQTPAASGGVKVRAYLSSDSSLVQTTPTIIAFNSESFDTGSDFASNTFTAPEDGYYQITSRINTNGTREFDLYIYINGAASSTQFTTTSVDDLMISDVLYLNANDTAAIYGRYTGSVTGVTVYGGSTESYVTFIQL